jgi:hypothetical protein
VAYVWDDHDYGGNDADRTSPSRPAALQTYRQMTPHFPPAGDAETPIYQAFTVGQVRFVMTDNRFADERRAIADAIAERHVANLLMVSGDAHMLAFDDGTHTDFSTS